MKKNTKQKKREIVTLSEAKKSKKKRSTVGKGIQYDRTTDKFIVEYYYGIIDGKAKREHKTFSTLKEAQESLIRFKSEKINGIPINQSKKMTFGDCLGEHIDTANIEQTTKHGYNVIKKRIEKTPLFKKHLCDIRPKDIDDYTRHAQNLGFKNVTINKDLDLIVGTFKYAALREYIPLNSIPAIKRLKNEEYTYTTLDKAKARDCLDKLTATNDFRLIIPFYLGLFQGMRRGEIVGLRWENVDLEKDTICICETITQISGTIIKKPPKTESSKRVIGIHRAVKEILIKAKEEQQKQGIFGDYVVVNEEGKHINPTFLSKKFQEFREKNGFHGVRFHDLRHSFATIALTDKINPVAVSGAMGHSKVSTTLSIYVHSQSLEGSREINDIFDI